MPAALEGRAGAASAQRCPPPHPQVTYGSFDYTSLLYLSDYLDDFGGGRFVFMEEGANKTVEPRAGGTCRRPWGVFWGRRCVYGAPAVCPALPGSVSAGLRPPRGPICQRVRQRVLRLCCPS